LAEQRGRIVLTIRREQMESLGEQMERRFVERTVAHVRRYFAARCRELGDKGTREMVLYGVTRAKAHGFTAEADVSKYIDVMFAYGRDFDVAPELPWASRILEDPSLGNPETRINALCDEASLRQ